MKICVYCASSPKIDDIYFEATALLAREFVENEIDVVYGGGSSGLMGILADTMIENGGRIHGIIPRFMYELGWAHNKLTDLLVTESMHERREKYLVNIDGIVALPGGSGTLEELFEIITLKRLGRFNKPIIILNTNGFYDPLKAVIEKCIDERFMDKADLKMWRFVNDPLNVLKHFKN